MSANIEQAAAPYIFRAWCPICQDGINTTRRVTAEGWVATHNRLKHSQAATA